MIDHPVSPRDYLPIARQIMEHRDEIEQSIRERDQLDVARADQRTAAARDALSDMREVIQTVNAAGIEMQRLPIGIDAKSLAWALALGGAINRRVRDDRRCPHAHPGAQKPLKALLSARAMFCADCQAWAAARVTLGEDDGRCDVCDRLTTEFSEFTGAFGPVQAVGNICGICRYWVEGLRRKPG